MYYGSCLCEGIQFSLEAITGDYVYCHCKSCRKASGSAFCANVSVHVDEFKILKGNDLINTYESSPGKVRHFCKSCGSPLFTKVGGNPSMIRLRLGTLDTEFKKTPSAHIFVEEAASWEKLTDDLPKYETWPPADALKLHGSRQTKND